MKPNRITEEQAFRRLAALCSQAEHCSYEMTEKMRRWGLEEDTQARIIEKLAKGRYVDDGRFCRMFVRDKLRFNKWGRRKIEQALWAKHIDESIYRGVLDSIDGSEYAGVLMPLLESKRREIKAASEYERGVKLIKFALGRGFTMDIIRQCLDTDTDYAED